MQSVFSCLSSQQIFIHKVCGRKECGNRTGKCCVSQSPFLYKEANILGGRNKNNNIHAGYNEHFDQIGSLQSGCPFTCFIPFDFPFWHQKTAPSNISQKTSMRVCSIRQATQNIGIILLQTVTGVVVDRISWRFSYSAFLFGIVSLFSTPSSLLCPLAQNNSWRSRPYRRREHTKELGH